MTEPFYLLLVGFGRVAQRFVRLLDERRTPLARRHGFSTRIVGVTTRRHGEAFSPRGLAPHRLIRPAAPDGRGHPPDGRAGVRFIAAALKSPMLAGAARRGRVVVVETTTLDVVRGEPAIEHVRTALASGAHVITANKGPAAFAYRRLARAADRAGRRFLFEGAVMDGVPVFNLVRETLPTVEVLGFRGVVNTTTNYILTAMERGRSLADALAVMRAEGIAEADASLDVDGWDAAAKAAALANVLMGAELTPHDVDRTGLDETTSARIAAARGAGRRVKLVASAERVGRAVNARVAPVEVARNDLLAGLEGRQNALILKTDLLEEVAIVQGGGSVTETAYALLSDLVAIARGVGVSDRSSATRSAARGRTRRTR